MSIDFAKIQEQVRSVLKSLAPLKPGGQAAEPPVDPDSLDPRLEGAAPTEEGMAAAGEEAGAGQGAGGEEGGEGGEGGEPDGDEAGEGGGDANDAGAEDEGRPVEKSLDEGDAFGNQDFDPEEIRRLEKAYGNGTGEGEPSELIKGGPDLMAVLGTILHAMEDQQVVLQALHDEVQTLKHGQTATNRKLSKALAEMQPEGHIPIAPAPLPKAVTRVVAKALVPEPNAPIPLTPDQIFAQMKSGALTQDGAIQAARQNRVH